MHAVGWLATFVAAYIALGMGIGKTFAVTDYLNAKAKLRTLGWQ
jgi:hypothetical protein